MNKCNKTKIHFKDALKSSSNHEEFSEKIRLHFNPLINPIMFKNLSNFINQKPISQEFLTKYFTKKVIGVDGFEGDGCICDRFAFIKAFVNSDAIIIYDTYRKAINNEVDYHLLR